MPRRSPRRRAVPQQHLLAAMAVLYGPSTPATRAEAEQIAREHLGRIERGDPWPRASQGRQRELFSGPVVGLCSKADR